MEGNKYNGWTNRETWLVALWLGDYFSERVEEMASDYDDIDVFRDALAEEIEDYVDELIDEKIGDDGFLRDLINNQDINYSELAAAYVYDCDAWKDKESNDEEEE